MQLKERISKDADIIDSALYRTFYSQNRKICSYLLSLSDFSLDIYWHWHRMVNF